MSTATVTPFPAVMTPPQAATMLQTSRGQIKHGCSTPKKIKLYNIWFQARARCHKPDHRKYPAYGARGIQMCEEWREDVAAFVAYMDYTLGPKPEGCSLDRVDNDGNYAPGNLKWSTTFQQANNKRTNRSVTYRRNRYSVAQFSRMIEKDPRGVLRSLNRGKSPEQIAAIAGFKAVLPLA